jgi:cell wall-associated NlpC family hydrolase
MSGFEVALLTTALGTASSMAQASQQRKVQSQAQALQAQQAQDQVTELQRQHARAEEDRQDRLKRAAASQRAAFAGSGITSDGSGEAVFDNLLTQSLREKQEIDDQMDRSLRSIGNSMQFNLLRQPRSDPFSMAASLVQTGVGLHSAGKQHGFFK